MDEALRLQRHLPLFRACAGWTAKDLADQLDVSRQSVSAWENYDGGKEKKGVKLSKAYYLAIRHEAPYLKSYQDEEDEEDEEADCLEYIDNTDKII